MKITVRDQIIWVEEGSDETGNIYFRFRVGSVWTSPFSIKHLLGDATPLFAELGNLGVRLLTKSVQTTFLKDLESMAQAEHSFTVATQVGWHGSAFVLPDEIIGESDLPLALSFTHLDATMLGKYRSKGSLDDWNRNIGDICEGNSRLMFLVALAFTGPILRFCDGVRTGGFQCVGEGEDGKTTATMVAGSVLGCHRSTRRQGFLQSWNTTTGQAELTACAHNDLLLPLDETKRAGKKASDRAEQLIDMIFALSEGTEKQRLTNAAPARDFRGYFVSTSNLTVSQLAQQGKAEVDNAVLGRCADIPSGMGDHGIYEQLHGFPDGTTLSDALNKRCRRYYGTPLRKFLSKLVAEHRDDRKGLKRFLSKRREDYLKEIKERCAKEGLRPLNRVSARCATAYAAGRLAIRYGILDWNRKALLEAILTCQMDGIRLVSGPATEKRTVAVLREKVVEYLRQNKAEFMDLDVSRPQRGTSLDDTLGFSATFKREKWLYLTAEKFRALVGSDKVAKALIKALVGEDMLVNGVQRPIFQGGKGNKNHLRVHAFRVGLIN